MISELQGYEHDPFIKFGGGLVGFEIIVAHDLNQGIGLNNELPWSCPKDMAYFKSLTIGEDGQNNAVIMGRKTWESIPENLGHYQKE